MEDAPCFEALGYDNRSPIEFLNKVAKQADFPELKVFRGLIGPTGVDHRYISEDASTCVSLLVSLGEMIDVPTPLSRVLLALVSAVTNGDYPREGRTIEKLGLSGLTVKELNEFLANAE